MGKSTDGDIFMYGNLFIKTVLANTNSIIMIEDSGMGVTKYELVINFGKNAKSGTKAFMEDMSAGSDIFMLRKLDDNSDLAFMVFDKGDDIPNSEYQRLHGGLEYWRRHHHERTVRH